MDPTGHRRVLSVPALLLAILLPARVGWAASEATPGDRPRFCPQLGHTKYLKSVAFSPDGRWALSGSDDRTLKLWDLSSGREILTFKGHTDRVMSVAFSPNGQLALSGSEDSTLKLWDVSSGRDIRTLKGHTNSVMSAAFSPDGQLVLSGSRDNTLKLWDVSSGREIRTFEGHTRPVFSVAFSPDGQRALSGSQFVTPSWDGQRVPSGVRSVTSFGIKMLMGGEMKLWEVSSGRQIRTFKGHTDEVNSVAFSPDGQRALSGSEDGSLKLWDVSSGREIRTFKGHTDSVMSAAFSPDGRWALSGSVDRTVKLWDVWSRREIRTFKGHESPVSSVAISPDGRRALSSGYDLTLRLWDVSSGQEIRTFRGHTSWVTSVAFSPDGQFALSGNHGSTVKLWGVSSGRWIRTFKGHTSWVTSVAFSPDGQWALSGGYGWTVAGEIKLWDVSSGRQIRTFEGHTMPVHCVAFSPDVKWALSGGGNYHRTEMKLWDVSSGREIRTFRGHRLDVRSVAFSPDGRLALSGSWDGTLKLWGVSSGREIRTFEGHRGMVRSVAFSPDGRRALSGAAGRNQGGEMKLWDVSSGREIRTFKGHRAEVWSVAFSPDGQWALSGTAGPDREGEMRLWDVSSGQAVRTFGSHRAWVLSVCFSPGGRQALSGLSDGTVRVWNTGTGREIVAMTAGTVDGRGEWLIHTPDGYFDSSRRGGELVHAVKGLQVFGIDQMAMRNNRPDIILKRMGSKDQSLIDHFHTQYGRRLRRAGFTEEQLLAGYHVPEATILSTRQAGKFVAARFHLSDPRHDLKQYNVYVNDVPLFGAYGKPVVGRSAALTEKVELTGGANKIEVTCMNVVGAESWRAMAVAQYDKQVQGDLYYVGFGVSKYRDRRLNLRYAHKDAEDIARVFGAIKGKYRNVHVKVFLNEDVTVENIKSAKQFLKDARVDDTFVLFIAGHGMYERSKEATYYFLTHDADLSDLSGTAADFDLIEGLLQGIAPRRKLFLMDTCESGELEEDTQGRFVAMAQTRGVRLRTVRGLADMVPVGTERPKPRLWLHQRDRYIYNDLLRRSGAIVFSSCRGGEMSCESDKVQNGFFTEAIIQALTSPVADKDVDKMISTKELRQYVWKTVSDWTGGCQNPTVDRDNIHMEFGLPMTGDE